MEVILKFASVFSAGMFTGAGFYLTIVEHPARMSVGVAFALQEFRPSYKRAALQQGALAIVCFLSSAAVAAPTHDWIWLIGGCWVGAVVSFTLFFIMPTNRMLLRCEFRGRISEIAPCEVGGPSCGARNLEPAWFPFAGLENRGAALIFHHRDLRLSYPVQ